MRLTRTTVAAGGVAALALAGLICVRTTGESRAPSSAVGVYEWRVPSGSERLWREDGEGRTPEQGRSGQGRYGPVLSGAGAPALRLELLGTGDYVSRALQVDGTVREFRGVWRSRSDGAIVLDEGPAEAVLLRGAGGALIGRAEFAVGRGTDAVTYTLEPIVR